jgi:arylsulfatase A-like enzyme
MRNVNLVLLFLSASPLVAQISYPKPDKPNVLLIVVDDLRPELGSYGKSYIKSPNIDRLTRSGIVFKSAYVNYPVCGPSRASLLSGLYPGKNRYIPWNCSQDKDVPGVVSLPMHFRNNNYFTVSLGKVYNNFEDGKGSWDEIWRPAKTTIEWDYQSKEGIKIFEDRNKERFKNPKIRNNSNLPKPGPAYEKAEIPDIAYEDGRIAVRAIETLQKFRNSSQSFFLAVGFMKPHLPFNAPVKYWNTYDDKDIKLPQNSIFPKDSPEASMFNWSELRSYYGIPQDGPLPDTIAKNLIHGYYACVSYVDAQIGKVIDALEELGMAQNTIILLCGDNGWFLGEHGFWSKHSNLERGSHVPLIVKVPWTRQGQESSALVELVDIYPTLCDLAGLNRPFHLQGKSFVPLLENPDQTWKEEVFYRLNEGETILTKTYTYTEWINPKSGKSYARMLYDHRTDPEENVNISELPQSEEVVRLLQKKLYNHLKSRDNIIIP